MISWSRSASNADASFIEPTTSANSTVTCLCSPAAGREATGEPHTSQTRDRARKSLPHDRHRSVASVARLTIPRVSSPVNFPHDRPHRGGNGFQLAKVLVDDGRRMILAQDDARSTHLSAV